MALIECPKCKREISDKADSCPRCGSLLKKPNRIDYEWDYYTPQKTFAKQPVKQAKQKNIPLIALLSVAGVLVVVICVVLIANRSVFSTTNKNDTKAKEASAQTANNSNDSETQQIDRAKVQQDVFKARASAIEKAINDIGTITDDSEDAIDNARLLYNSAPSEIQAYVSNYDLLQKAEQDYKDLKKEEREQIENAEIERVEALIDKIGTVTIGSGNAIKAAQTAYDDLSGSLASKVSNKSVLQDAQSAYSKLSLDKANSLLKNFQSHYDKFQDTFYYYPSIWKFASDGSILTDGESYVRPYIGVNEGDNTVWILIAYLYTGDDWIFWDNAIFLIDGQKYTKYMEYYDIVHDNGGGTVWESINQGASASDIEMLQKIAMSNTTDVRLSGDNYSSDFTISSTEKQAIQQVLNAFNALVDAGFTPLYE